MIYRTATRLEPADPISFIDRYRHDEDQDYSDQQATSGNQKDNEDKEHKLQNQIYMENSVLLDVGQNINMYV